MAAAMRIGSRASAMAVFIRTASQPISMASTASEAAPTPASTSTGTVACSMIRPRFRKFWIPRPEPIGAPSGGGVLGIVLVLAGADDQSRAEGAPGDGPGVLARGVLGGLRSLGAVHVSRLR